MDKSSLTGIILGILAVTLSMVLKGSSLMILFNAAAIMIILVGTLAAVVIAFPMNELKKLPALFRILFTDLKIPTVQELIPQFKEWTTIARREGLLALDNHVDEIEDPFLKHGLKMVIDGQPPEFVRETLERELDSMEYRHAAGAQIFSQAGTYAPTLGVLGAVMGLIAALGHINDIDTLGPAISAAFVATLLGIFTGYVLWHPFANKLRRKSQQEIFVKQLMIEGILSIQEGVSARMIEDKLLTYVPTNERQLLDEVEMGERENING